MKLFIAVLLTTLTAAGLGQSKPKPIYSECHKEKFFGRVMWTGGGPWDRIIYFPTKKECEAYANSARPLIAKIAPKNLTPEDK